MPGPFTGTPFPYGTRVHVETADRDGRVVAVGREPTTGKPNGWYMVEYETDPPGTFGAGGTYSHHHSDLDSIPPKSCPQ